MAKKTRKEAVKCNVRILCPLLGVYPKYQPTVGEVYEAYYKMATQRKSGKNYSPVCVINVLDKKICLQKGEYEIVEGV
jgi:hypothetical protein